MTYEHILNNVAKELELPVDLVRNTYRAYWKFIKDTIQLLPLKDNISEEEFNSLRTNFNIPSLGKLYCTKDRYMRMRRRFEHILKLRNKNVKD